MVESQGGSTDAPGSTRGAVEVSVTNIGGVSQGRLAIQPGVTVLAGENASNKSSLLQGVSAVLGGPTPSLKSDADRGEVVLDVDGEEYYVAVESKGGRTVVTDERRYSPERDLCELFVSLDEMNPIRRAVVGDGDLHDLLMRPVDTDEIEAEIARLERRKVTIDEQIAERDRLEDRLTSLESREASLEADLEAVERELTETRRAVRDIEADGAASEDAQDLLDALEATRNERETVRNRVETQRNAITSLREERESVRDRLESRDDDGSDDELASVTEQIEQLRQQKTALTNTINSLSPIVEMNQQLLGDESTLPDRMAESDVLGELDPSSRELTCWTCGSHIERAQIAEQVQVVQEIIQENREQRRVIDDQIASLTERKHRIEAVRAEREDLADRDHELDREVTRRERALSDLEADLDALDEEIADLESAVEETAELRDSEVVDLHQRASELEYERGQLESTLESVRAEIEDAEVELDRRADLIEEREAVTARLQAQRDRIESIERETVETINECMQDVLDLLGYRNVERVWVERVARRGRSDADFELHVVRTSDDGVAYEDVIGHLSKSEREVIGLVVALAGYIVHDVGKEVPVVVVDAIEMLDADRIRALLDFFTRHADYVIAAALPEEASELAGDYPQVDVHSAVTA